MGRRLLVLPHVGTALGHLIRVGDILNVLEKDWDEIFVSIPKYAEPHARRFLTGKTRLIVHDALFTVTGAIGTIDLDGFLRLLQVNRKVIDDLRPDFILGDPGIHAGILAEEFHLPWGLVAHAPYFSFPEILNRSGEVELARAAWSIIHAALDRLVEAGTRGTFRRWEELRVRAYENISVGPDGLFSRNGSPILFSSRDTRRGWAIGKPLQCLITVSSGDNLPVPRFLTDYLALHFDEVGVVGHNKPHPHPRVRYLGTDYDLRTLVSSETTVITHGGSGTLQCLAGARSITIVPGDLDQLCNGLLAHAYGKAALMGLRSWKGRLRRDAPFVRCVPWEEYLEQSVAADLQNERLLEIDMLWGAASSIEHTVGPKNRVLDLAQCESRQV